MIMTEPHRRTPERSSNSGARSAARGGSSAERSGSTGAAPSAATSSSARARLLHRRDVLQLRPEIPIIAAGVILGRLLLGPGWPLHWILLAVWIASLPLVPAVFRYSRGLFIHFDRYFDPEGVGDATSPGRGQKWGGRGGGGGGGGGLGGGREGV